MSTVQFVHILVFNFSRRLEKEEGRDPIQRKRKLHENANTFLEEVEPNQVIDSLSELQVVATEGKRLEGLRQSADAKQVLNHVIETTSLVATHILSLKHWLYSKDKRGEPIADWYSDKWLKTKALEFASYLVALNKKNDKFLNQLLSIAIYEYEALPQLS